MSQFDGSYAVILANLVGFALAFVWFIIMCVVAVRWLYLCTSYRTR